MNNLKKCCLKLELKPADIVRVFVGDKELQITLESKSGQKSRLAFNAEPDVRIELVSSS